MNNVKYNVEDFKFGLMPQDDGTFAIMCTAPDGNIACFGFVPKSSLNVLEEQLNKRIEQLLEEESC